jgi:hypothetical protein
MGKGCFLACGFHCGSYGKIQTPNLAPNVGGEKNERGGNDHFTGDLRALYGLRIKKLDIKAPLVFRENQQMAFSETDTLTSVPELRKPSAIKRASHHVHLAVDLSVLTFIIFLEMIMASPVNHHTTLVFFS